MKASNRTIFSRAALLSALLVALLVCQASAGGPICPQPRCMPPMCAPQPCCPPPVCCPPPACAPPMCAPKPCCPPQQCEENPLAMILKGTCKLVAGVVALPFKIVGCLTSGPCARPACYPMRPACPPMAMMCPPPMCPPPMCVPQPCCPPPSCGMGYCPPGMGYGMGMMPAPMGYGRPKPMMRPMAKNQKTSLPKQLLAGPAEGLFGTYW